ncbi:xanthine dehydrogenase family protein molybdopterin-binding subunit [Sabulicella rubraurantiaca]|uniref:xanthine dehydrogenase family protein molybdopterin-binding subunit n=1 Tax=Sabulicella rubraurantiaca TaxID=2811429 RepID=UPI001A95D42E|nr:xanthine dehydrogenase family protein molybdopterin-binding subunit [Sabulicella rubraurantiaca]
MNAEMRPKHVGSRVPRREDPRLLTGEGRFVADLMGPGTLHLAIRRSEHGHARIMRIGTEAAAAMPGVVAVVTASGLAGALQPVHATSRMPRYQATATRALAEGKLRYVGEPVAAVLATSRYLAEDAAEMIEVEAEPLPELSDPEAAALPDAPVLNPGTSSNILVERVFGRGAVEEVLMGAAVRVGGRFRFRRKAPVAIEPRACLAEVEKGSGRLTLHSSTQVPGILRDALSEALDLPGHLIRVVAPDVGGGFGGKASLYPEELLVCALARRFRKTIGWIADRLEDLVSTSHGFDEIVDAELGLDADGGLAALTAEILGDVGAGSIYPWTAALEPVQVASFLPGPYRLPAYRGSVRAVATSKAPTGPYRGVGRPIAAFVMERLMDMAAARLGLDPVEIRRRNLIRPEEFPYKIGSGIVWDRSGFHESLEAACKAGGYAALREEQAKLRAEGRKVGVGIACYAELTGIGSRISAAPGMPINTGTETARIELDSTGAVTARFGVASHGQGLETTLAQVIADELGARLQDIHIVQGDSAAVPHGTGTYASRSAVLAGGAATLAARTLRAKVTEAAAHLLEASPGDLEAHDSRVMVAGTDRGLSFREVARAVYSEMGRFPRDARPELEASETYDPYFGTTASATHLAVVEVDPGTYGVRLLRYVVAEDCGKMINPMVVDGQVHGGVAQGIGAALLEEVVYDERSQIVTASLVDYSIPTAAEIPRMLVHHVESGPAPTLGGFRGMGEGGTIGAPAAIANALSDALGISVQELPATAERLFRATNL